MEFSVSICVYEKDNPEYFRQAMDSVLHQTCIPDEVVLVVDGPVSDTLDQIIKAFKTEKHVNVFRLPKNKGHGAARRCGLYHCTKPLVALMDADDICAPDRFEKQLNLFSQYPDLDLAGGNLLEFEEKPSHIVGRRTVKQTDWEIKEDLKRRCPFNQQTVMFRRKAVMEAGGYRDWFCDEDYYLWIRMYLHHCRFANLKEDLVYFRVSDQVFERRGGWQYFRSEAKLQRLMLISHVITLPRFFKNVAVRFVVQVGMTNAMRRWFYRHFAREGGEG